MCCYTCWFFTEETKSLLTKNDLEEYLDYKVAMKDSYSKDLTFFLEDMPHMMKRIVNTLYNSSKDDETCNMHYDEYCLNLGMIRQVWEQTGGKKAGLHVTHLSQTHFDKDNFSNMRVYLSVQVVSGRVVKMFAMAFKDEIIKLPFTRKTYGPLLQLITHTNNFVDIINGNNDINFTPKDALPIAEELLKIFSWFHNWRELNQSFNLNNNRFLPEQTWNGFKRIILDYGMIDYYVIQRGMTIVPKRT